LKDKQAQPSATMQSDAPSTFWVPKSTSNSWIPEGYVLMTGPDNQDYIVPEFMVPVLDQDFNAKEKKKELGVSGALGTVSSQLSCTLGAVRLRDLRCRLLSPASL
jgi:hypothetical protein